MTQKEFMSGSELRQYLHISTRKMKYLMDNNYIPHENTGHTTHKYRVRTEDAVRFKTRMDTEPGFLSELSGMFSNRTEWHPLPMFEATTENCEAFRRWLDSQWAELPEALPTQTAAELVGHSRSAFTNGYGKKFWSALNSALYSTAPKRNLSALWRHRKGWRTRARENIRNSFGNSNTYSAVSVRMNSGGRKGK